MNLQDEQDNVFHERITILKNQGYRGFTLSKTQKKWDGVEVTARNEKGRTLTATSETNEEAFTKLIEQIDLALEK